jgi:hypothetical protein
LPNPNNAKDLNAYITIWHEDKETLLDECTSSCQDTEELCKELIEMLYEAKCSGDNAKAVWCMEYLKTLRSLEREKISQITLYMLENLEKELERNEEEKAIIAGKSICLV